MQVEISYYHANGSSAYKAVYPDAQSAYEAMLAEDKEALAHPVGTTSGAYAYRPWQDGHSLEGFIAKLEMCCNDPVEYSERLNGRHFRGKDFSMLKIERQILYGGPLARGKHYHYVAYLRGHQIATGDTKDLAQANAEETLLGAFQCTSNPVVASACSDGTVISTREYLPGQCEVIYHRRVDGCNGSMLGRMELEGKAVKVREYHKHYVTHYEQAVRGEVA